MLLIYCPYCQQKRDESEFTYGGEAHKPRPTDPDALDDEQWTEFLFRQKESKGLYFERWNHAAGCRKWFNVARNTVTSEIYSSYKAGEKAPDLDVEKPAY